jgi:hypothetical protein
MTAEDLQLFEELAGVRSRLATLVNRGPRQMPTQEYREQHTQLERRSRELEDALSARSAAFRRETQPVTLEKVQAALPAGAVLIEVFSYEPFDARTQRWDRARYVAYVLHRSGEPRWVDLGEVAVIDRKVETLRAALAMPDRQDSTARDLDELLLQPIRPFLGEASLLIRSWAKRVC